jgi:hypothetical protein
LPASFIISLKEKHEQLLALQQELPARIAESAKRLEAAMMFAPPDLAPNAEETPPTVSTEPAKPPIVKAASQSSGARGGRRDISWGSEIERVLVEESRGMSHASVLARLQESPISKNPSKGNKGFYNAIVRLSANGQVIKHGGLLYAASVEQKLRESGALLPDTSGGLHKQRGGTGALILKALLDAKPEGLTGPEVKQAVANMPGAPQSLMDHGQYIYNLLASVIGAGAVERSDNLYRLTESGRSSAEALRSMDA